jgi:hypothetical protein
MRLAHVRERHAPVGSPWRLVAALDYPPRRWLDLAAARRRAVRARPALEHDRPLYRRPVATLDVHLSAGRRVAELADLLEGFTEGSPDDDAVLDGDLVFGSVPLIGEHEFHFVAFAEVSEVLPAVAVLFAAAGRLEIDDSVHPRVELAHVALAAGLDQDSLARIA